MQPQKEATLWAAGFAQSSCKPRSWKEGYLYALLKAESSSLAGVRNCFSRIWGLTVVERVGRAVVVDRFVLWILM